MNLHKDQLIQIQKEIHNCRIDLENQHQHQHIHETTEKPTFKPNTNLGEGKPSKTELKVRKELLDILKDTYNQAHQVMTNTSASVQMKTQTIESIANEYETKASQHLENSIHDLYEESYEDANKKLEKAGVTRVHYTTSPALEKLLNYMKANVHRWAVNLQEELTDQIYKREYWMERYG